MTARALVRKGFDIYARNGAIRTFGIVAGFCGRRIDDRSQWFVKIRERDRGKGIRYGSASVRLVGGAVPTCTCSWGWRTPTPTSTST